jgi:outer membrane protein TolC
MTLTPKQLTEQLTARINQAESVRNANLAELARLKREIKARKEAVADAEGRIALARELITLANAPEPAPPAPIAPPPAIPSVKPPPVPPPPKPVTRRRSILQPSSDATPTV